MEILQSLLEMDGSSGSNSGQVGSVQTIAQHDTLETANTSSFSGTSNVNLLAIFNC